MKLFYFLDFEHVRQYGIPVTFDTYFKLEKGPIPSAVMSLIDEASEDSGKSLLADTVKFQRPTGTERMLQTLPVRKFTNKEAKIFLESELKILKEVCKRFENSTMEEIKEASHKEAPWLESKMFQPISYTLAAKHSNSKFTEKEIELSVKISG